jgi:hypothetical protein
VIWPKSRIWLVEALPGGGSWRRSEVTPAVEGKLTMEGDALVFRPITPGDEPSVIPLDAIAKVKRAHGSAVIELRLRGRKQGRVVWFYFVQPPPGLPKGAGRGLRLYAARRGSGRLAMANALWGDEVSSWYQRIREALGGRRER